MRDELEQMHNFEVALKDDNEKLRHKIERMRTRNIFFVSLCVLLAISIFIF